MMMDWDIGLEQCTLTILLLLLGEFGVVYKGYMKSSTSDAIRDTVAVKTLKG